MLPQELLELPNNRERLLLISTNLVHSLQLGLHQLRFSLTNPIRIILLLCACLVVACVPQVRNDPGAGWDYTDLRMLSHNDQRNTEGDFIAGYSRSAGNDFQLRFDLLDLAGPPMNDFYVALDFSPGGSQYLPIQGEADISWDTLLYLPAAGLPQAFSPSFPGGLSKGSGYESRISVREDIIPRIVRIPWQDYVLISLNQSFFPRSLKGIKIQAFSTAPGSTEIRDSIGPFSSNALPPEQAPLVLTFWNTLPAYSPAQTLRKWDGAHTGPFGERHGLSILLENVSRSSIPVVLLDLRAPSALSALDQLNARPLIKELLADKLLILPDTLPGSPSFPLFPDGLPEWAPEYYPEYANLISNQFDIPSSDMLYVPRLMDGFDLNYVLYFSPAEHNSPYGFHIPLPPQIPQEPQASPEGIPLTIRKKLLKIALQNRSAPSGYPILVLGGSLQESAFADPASAASTLSYIANHPWIKPLDGDALRSLPAHAEPQYLPGNTIPSSTEQFAPSSVLSNLPEPGYSPSNPLYLAAWDSALSLYAPLPPESNTLAQLRSNYTGQPGILLAAAQWEDNPYSSQDCLTDPDQDGIPECILTSEDQFAVIDLLGARLIAYFYRTESGIHQIIAPTSQLIVGLGDPSTWQMEAHEGADPVGIHGAFADSPPPWPQYQVSLKGSKITFTSPGQQVKKTYYFSDNGLIVTYHSSDTIIGRIPVAIDPWRRFSPGWSDLYKYQPIENGYSVAIAGDISIDVVSDLPLAAYSFTDSQRFLDSPEDPNFDYPSGHYLPYPFTVLGFEGLGDFSFHFKSSP